jgi:hypothetical protein
MQYGRDEDRDVAGFVERIGPNRWRLVMPYPHFESTARRDRAGPLRSALMKALLFACRHAHPAARRRATLSDAIRADMPQLMTLYRDLHANPELSMQEVRTPAKLAPEMRKLGFDVTEHVGKTGVVAVMKNGPGPGAADPRRHGRAAGVEQTGLPFASKVRGKRPLGRRDRRDARLRPRHAHDDLARHRAAAGGDEGPMVGTLVMILQPGEETGEGAKAMLDDGLYTRFPKPDYRARLPRRAHRFRRA